MAVDDGVNIAKLHGEESLVRLNGTAPMGRLKAGVSIESSLMGSVFANRQRLNGGARASGLEARGSTTRHDNSENDSERGQHSELRSCG